MTAGVLAISHRGAIPPLPEPAFAARPRLAALRDELARAVRPRYTRRPPWNEPPLFFFDPTRQAELEATRGSPPAVRPDPLAERIAAELSSLFASVEVRRVARATPGLTEAAAALAPHHPAAKELADLLAVPDDEVFLVLHPATRSGFRLHVAGVADVAQFHLLILDTAVAEGVFPGPPPPARFRAACREADPLIPAGVPMVAEGRFQLFAPAAIGPDGSVPPGFRGCDHWLWGTFPLARVPRVDGERVVLLGEPAYRLTWEVERRFPALPAEADVVQVLGQFAVAERLSRLAGQPVSPRVPGVRTDRVAKAA